MFGVEPFGAILYFTGFGLLLPYNRICHVEFNDYGYAANLICGNVVV
jgi:hypothetical protein